MECGYAVLSDQNVCSTGTSLYACLRFVTEGRQLSESRLMDCAGKIESCTVRVVDVVISYMHGTTVKFKMYELYSFVRT